MKVKNLLLTSLTVLFLSVSYGQNKIDAQEMADYQTDVMTEELSLSDTQKEEVNKLNLEFSEKQRVLMSREGSMFSKMSDMKKIGKEKNKALREVLTEEQMEKYKDDIEPKIRKNMREKLLNQY